MLSGAEMVGSRKKPPEALFCERQRHPPTKSLLLCAVLLGKNRGRESMLLKFPWVVKHAAGLGEDVLWDSLQPC